MISRCLLVGIFFCSAFCSVSLSADSVDYLRDVFPILEKYCVSCHSADDSQGGLVMDSYDALVKGGESGLAITAGVPASSRMLMMASGKMKPVMPPDGAEGPSESEMELLSRWVEQGASGPEGDMPVKRSLRTPKIEPSPNVVAPITAIAVSADGSRTARATFGRIELTDDIRDSESKLRMRIWGKSTRLPFSRDASRLVVGSGSDRRVWTRRDLLFRLWETGSRVCRAPRYDL